MIFSAQLSQICFYLVSCLICYWVMLVSKENCMLLLLRWKIWSEWISKKSKTRLKIEKRQQADFRLLPETSLVIFPRFLILNHQCIKVHLNKWFFPAFLKPAAVKNAMIKFIHSNSHSKYMENSRVSIINWWSTEPKSQRSGFESPFRTEFFSSFQAHIFTYIFFASVWYLALLLVTG